MSEHEAGAGGRRTLLAGAVAVGLAAAAAVAAISTSRGPDGPGAAVTTTALGGTRSRRVEHAFTPIHTGAVWLTVTSTGGSERDVELVWGQWRRMFPPRAAGPVTYWFEKKDVPSMALAVEVPDDVEIAFGEGGPPDGSVDARSGWTKRTPTGAEVPPAA